MTEKQLELLVVLVSRVIKSCVGLSIEDRCILADMQDAVEREWKYRDMDEN